ncbi:hypothetical protein KCP70_13820 [Salmonella enterica subsp. enterica]|nr:hypothetical protein KCP70_13820 [Salmonella enterica subsp. enterica]
MRLVGDCHRHCVYVPDVLRYNLWWDLLSVGLFFFVGTLFLVVRESGCRRVINDPIMGWIVNATRSRCKISLWILSGTPTTSLVLFPAVQRRPSFEGTAQVVACLRNSLYILWGMTYTIMDTSHFGRWKATTLRFRDKREYREREQLVPFPRVSSSPVWLAFVTAAGITPPFVNYALV